MSLLFQILLELPWFIALGSSLSLLGILYRCCCGAVLFTLLVLLLSCCLGGLCECNHPMFELKIF